MRFRGKTTQNKRALDPPVFVVDSLARVTSSGWSPASGRARGSAGGPLLLQLEVFRHSERRRPGVLASC